MRSYLLDLEEPQQLSEGTVLTVSTLASPPGCRRMGFEDKQLTSCTALTLGVLDGGHDHDPSGTARQVTLVVLQGGEALIGIKARERRHRAEQLWFSLRVMPAIHFHVLFAVH